MSKKNEKSWPELAFDSWMLAGEVSTVMWLRSVRLMMGGPRAHAEAERMVSEKIEANLGLLPAIFAGGLMPTPQKMSEIALAHYRSAVRANRRRLSRR